MNVWAGVCVCVRERRSLCSSRLQLRLLRLNALRPPRPGLPAKALVIVALEGKELQEVGFAVEFAIVGGVVAQVQDNFTVDAAKAGPMEGLLVCLNLLHWVGGLLTNKAHICLGRCKRFLERKREKERERERKERKN